MKRRKTIGLALGSGAYRGFAHIGVIRSLEKNNIPIDYLSGASIGAWAAAYYACFRDISYLEKDVIDNQRENMSWLLDFGAHGLISGTKFLAYLEKRFNHCAFSDLQIPLSVAATDLITGEPFVFTSGTVAEAVRASCAVPVIFKAFEHEGHLLVDGGLSNPVPVSLARDLGADIVIAVNLYNKDEFKKLKHTDSSVIVRSTMILLASLSEAVMSGADVIIEPDCSAFLKENNLSKYFRKQTADKMIRIGEEATDRAIPLIRKLLREK